MSVKAIGSNGTSEYFYQKNVHLPPGTTAFALGADSKRDMSHESILLKLCTCDQCVCVCV